MKSAPINAELDVQFDFTKSAAVALVPGLGRCAVPEPGDRPDDDRLARAGGRLGAGHPNDHRAGPVTDSTNNGNVDIVSSVPVSSVKIRYIENKATANNDNQYVGIGNLTCTGST